MTSIGFDGCSFGVGDRVELHPATDLWMRGARFGEIVRFYAGRAVVRTDRAGVVSVRPENLRFVSGSADRSGVSS